MLERRAARPPHSKALTIYPRTVEQFAMRGIAGRWLAEGRPVPSSHFALLKNRLDFAFLAADTRYPYTLFLPQRRTEELLGQYLAGKGQVRERRAEDACGSPRCAHPACWIEEAHVTKLTGLLREGPDGDQLRAWPKSMRVFARRERPHPGAQLSLFETADGWRYSLWATNPARQPGRRHTPALKSRTRNLPDDHQRQPSAPVKDQG